MLENERESIDTHDFIPFLNRRILDGLATGYPSLENDSQVQKGGYPTPLTLAKNTSSRPSSLMARSHNDLIVASSAASPWMVVTLDGALRSVRV